METPEKPGRMTVAEFMAWDYQRQERHELLNGDLIDIADENQTHSTIVANIRLSLSNRLRGTPCRVFQRGIPLITKGSALVRPDVMMICAKVDAEARFVTEPMVVFEVLSEHTERRDRIVKNRLYRTIPSLRQYVLVAQDRLSVESMVRNGDGWYHDLTSGLYGILQLPAHGLDLPLSQIYAETDILAVARGPVQSPSAMEL